MQKIAVYCRVSTDKEDQAHSFESQQLFFREYIQRQPGWELYRIYADEGLSGTSTQKRTAFLQMLQDARSRRFQRILTKEVSRFSRNILDTISCTRELRALGIEVEFLNDGIRTLEPDAELRLSIMGSLAQEESRRTSSRVKWGQTRRMEQGVVFGHSLLGYDVKDGRMTVNPQGARLVQLIFHKYVVERKGTTAIARELEEAGYRTLTGSRTWRSTVVLKILKNEKYCGDLKQKKTYTPDYLTHQKKPNHGQEPFVYLRDHHQPLVSRELWEAAQQEMARRDAAGTGSHGHRYPLSGKLRCGQCGQSLVSHRRRRKDGSLYQAWRPSPQCRLPFQLGNSSCIELVRQAVASLEVDLQEVLPPVIQAAARAVQESRGAGLLQARRLEKALDRLEAKRAGLLDAFLAGTLSQDDLELMEDYYLGQRQELESAGAALAKNQPPWDPASLKRDLEERAGAIARGETSFQSFYGVLLDSITVYPNRRLEVRLKHLPGVWTFLLEQQGPQSS